MTPASGACGSMGGGKPREEGRSMTVAGGRKKKDGPFVWPPAKKRLSCKCPDLVHPNRIAGHRVSQRR